MNIENVILPQDIPLATNLLKCIDYAVDRLLVEVKHNNLVSADDWVNEIIRCKRELQALIERKIIHDRSRQQLDKLVESFSLQGVDIRIVRRSRV